MIDDSNSLIGETLGSCRLERLIGQGGHAIVFLAWQEHLSRYVAVKVLRPQSFVNARLHNNFLARFKQEASVIAKFDHINIMSIYDYGEQDGLAYLVMPYLSRGSLRDVLGRKGSLSLQETLTFISQVASALDYAHAQNVIHRDLKPGNFLIHNDGRLALADFGIAQLVKESITGLNLTETGTLLGTPEYMAPEMISPEILHGARVDHRADIYELGIALYQMLSGDLPFTGNPTAIFLKHLQEPLPLLSPFYPTIPSSVDAVLQKATAKNRNERFASAGELAQALQRAINAPPMAVDSHYAPTILPLRFSPQTALASQGADDKTIPNVPGSSRVPQTVAVHATASTARPQILRRSRNTPFGFFIAILVLLVAIIVGPLVVMLANSTHRNQRSNDPPIQKQTPTNTPTPTYDTQKAVVTHFYQALGGRDYPTAYNLSHSDMADPNTPSQTYCSFVGGFAEDVDTSLVINGAKSLNDGTGKVEVDVTITVDETVPVKSSTQGAQNSTYETRKSVYEQYKIVQNGKIVDQGVRTNQTNGLVASPTIVAGPQSITMPDPMHSPYQQAQELIQEEYDYINNKDYQSAYNLWSNANQSECSFMLSYASAQNVAVQFGSITQLHNNTFSVPVAVTETVAGKSSTPDNKTYIVGQLSDGTWKILQVQ